MTIPIRHAIHPDHFKDMHTEQLRSAFLVEDLFEGDQIKMVYTHYDRLIIGGALPLKKALSLQTIDLLKANFFLERRELGIINVGGTGKVVADGTTYTLHNKEALYISRGTKDVRFLPGEDSQIPYFYFNSAPAHAVYPSRKIATNEAEVVELGSLETSNHRTIRKLIVNSVIETCQLQMGLTELKTGSVWNTMPAHTHDRRMEAYFYFDVPENQMVCHFIGQPQETRHIWIKNRQAVLSPPWSIHSGAGTSNYAFIWGMAGENLDYSDMDAVKPTELR
ncbi:MAG TPA: 5-dehydro-4-deoxy-D-glucuronate isomerase [Chryseolinea sp.]|nr:5-dehydro-4-deoxy-D-glucuronate isomerase [Chryseolinea sp.]HPH47420.1 5-dehydro-4-deoxy-D-glucuronate isomerase [Chryseolinea sp.]HPM32095.1 5-dehydro-4-deoxy-D-glucuronate isomerase [Chryseolinea sp.]